MRTFTLAILWQPLALAAVGACVALALRRAPGRFRSWLWLTVVMATGVGPVVTALFAASARKPAAVASSTMVISMPSAVSTGVELALPWAAIALATLSAARLMYLAAGWLWLLRVRRDADEVADGVLLSDRVPVPMTFGGGILAGEAAILVPRQFWQQAPAGTRDAVLAHERAHIERRDFAWNAFAELATLAVWWHPAVHWIRLRLAEARECACDEAADAAVSSYAESVVLAAQLISGRAAPAGALGIFDSNQLENRIMNLTHFSNRLQPRLAKALTGVALAAVAGVSMLLITRPVVYAAPQERSVQKAGENGVHAPKLISKVEPKYSQRAKDEGIEGKVVISLIINEDGTASDFEILQPLDTDLDANAITAIKEWVFAPATKDGKPVRVTGTIEVNFRLM